MYIPNFLDVGNFLKTESKNRYASIPVQKKISESGDLI
jgi:hypothetical protein